MTDDGQWIEQVLDGGVEALAAPTGKCQSPAHSLALRRVGRSEAAEETAQVFPWRLTTTGSEESLRHLLPRDFAEGCVCRCRMAAGRGQKQTGEEVVDMAKKQDCGCGCLGKAKPQAKPQAKGKTKKKEKAN